MMYQQKNTSGFSFIELMISVGIIAVITSVALINHQEFGNSIAVGNLAYDVALSVREAQVFGVSVKQLDDRGQKRFDVPYGINFLEGRSDYWLFADINGNNQYGGSRGCTQGTGGRHECVTLHQLNGGFTVTNICAAIGTGTCVDVAEVSILFKRPDPDAVIVGRTGTQYSSARITVGIQGETVMRDVVIQSSGHISVDPVQTP